MPGHADAEIAANMLRERERRRAETLRLFRANVTAVTSGIVSIQRGTDTDDEDAGYPVIVPGVPSVGDEVVCSDLGGAPVILGVLGTAATNQPRIGQTLVLPSSASAATVGSNTSNSTYVTLRAETFTDADIPDGTYTIRVSWDAAFSDSASGSVNGRVSLGATVDDPTTLSLTTARERVGYVRTFTGVAVSGGLTVTVEYKRDSGTGTLSARNPRLLVFATRTGV